MLLGFYCFRRFSTVFLPPLTYSCTALALLWQRSFYQALVCPVVVLSTSLVHLLHATACAFATPRPIIIVFCEGAYAQGI